MDADYKIQKLSRWLIKNKFKFIFLEHAVLVDRYRLDTNIMHGISIMNALNAGFVSCSSNELCDNCKASEQAGWKNQPGYCPQAD